VTAHDSTHLDPDTLAAFVDGALGAADRGRAEAHLAACDTCRHELLAVRQLLASYRPAAQRRRLVVPLAAAAALVLAVGLPMLNGGQDTSPMPPIRRPGAEAALAVSGLSPRPGSTVMADAPLEFAWGTAEAGSTYRLTVVDSAGALVWSTETGDTTAVLPADIALASGQSYFWYVDALRSDGRSLTSGAQRFSVK
jgi:hypothetical protein